MDTPILTMVPSALPRCSTPRCRRVVAWTMVAVAAPEIHAEPDDDPEPLGYVVNRYALGLLCRSCAKDMRPQDVVDRYELVLTCWLGFPPCAHVITFELLGHERGRRQAPAERPRRRRGA